MRDLADQATFTLPGSVTVLLLAQPPDDAASQELERLADGGGLTVVCAGDWPAARTTLRVLPDGRLRLGADRPVAGATPG